MAKLFLDNFPNHVYRYLDTSGCGRPPISTATVNKELNIQGYDSYFTVNGFANFKDNNSAEIEHCTNLTAFFVDIDGRKDLKELEQIKKLLPPTFIIETKNGFHVYYLLDEPLYREDMTETEWEEVKKRWNGIEQSLVSKLNGDKNAQDIARILRVPDTLYWKKSGDAHTKGIKDVFKIKGIYKELANRYSLDTLEDIFPIKKDEIISYEKI